MAGYPGQMSATADSRSALVRRSDFPLTERAAYLNSAGLGLMAAPVIRQHETFAMDLAERGTLAYFDKLYEIKQAPRAASARLFGAPLDCVAIVTSVSEAISQIAWWLRPRAGRNVVSIDIDAPSVTYPWLRVAEETGAEIRLVNAIQDPAALSIEQIASLVDDNTAAICVSHVQWRTGHRFNLSELAALAHGHGALIVIDAMQSAGVVPLDVVASDVDVLVTGSYKWLCGFAGVGACYVRRDLIDRLRPILVGANSVDNLPADADIDGCTINLPKTAIRLEYGSSAHTARFIFAHAINYMLDIGIERLLGHTQRLNRTLAEGAKLMGGVVVTPLDKECRAGILTVRFPGRDPFVLAARLAERGVIVMARLGGLRFSPHAFNDDKDVESALSALEEVVSRG